MGLFGKRSRRRPTLPHSYPCSTIGPEGLNFRVRDGNGCDPLGIATEKSVVGAGLKPARTISIFSIAQRVICEFVGYIVGGGVTTPH